MESESEGEYQQSVRLSIHVGHEQELRKTDYKWYETNLEITKSKERDAHRYRRL